MSTIPSSLWYDHTVDRTHNVPVSGPLDLRAGPVVLVVGPLGTALGAVRTCPRAPQWQWPLSTQVSRGPGIQTSDLRISSLRLQTRKVEYCIDISLNDSCRWRLPLLSRAGVSPKKQGEINPHPPNLHSSPGRASEKNPTNRSKKNTSSRCGKVLLRFPPAALPTSLIGLEMCALPR